MESLIYFFFSHSKNRVSPQNSGATENVAVKEEPTDRGYVEPTPVTNLTSSRIQEPPTGKNNYSNFFSSIPNYTIFFSWSKLETLVSTLLPYLVDK